MFTTNEGLSNAEEVDRVFENLMQAENRNRSPARDGGFCLEVRASSALRKMLSFLSRMERNMAQVVNERKLTAGDLHAISQLQVEIPGGTLRIQR